MSCLFAGMAHLRYLYPLLLLAAVVLHGYSTNASVINPARVKQISWKPRFKFPQILSDHDRIVDFQLTYLFNISARAFVYEGFLTGEECDHLVSLVSLHDSVSFHIHTYMQIDIFFIHATKFSRNFMEPLGLFSSYLDAQTNEPPPYS